MGCCSKRVSRKKVWSRQEDSILINYINQHGPGQWTHLPTKAGLKRCGKSCRFRWLNYLRPDIKRGSISADEEDLVMRLHQLLGNRWSLIAGRLPGRTDNEIKNLWNTRLKKRVPKHQESGEDRNDKVIRPKAVRCIRAINMPYPHHQHQHQVAILNKRVEDHSHHQNYETDQRWVDTLMALEQGRSCSKVVNAPNSLNPQSNEADYGGNNMVDDHNMSKEAMDLSALLSSFLNSDHDQWIQELINK